MIEFFLKRKILSNLLTVFLIVVGAYQFVRVRREAFPDFSFDIVIVEALYPGASPQEVERLVTAPIEDELRGVNGIDKVQSWSLEDRTQIIIWLDEDLRAREVDKAVQEIQQAVNRVKDLPEEVDRPIAREVSSDRPLITLSVAGGTEEARDRFAEELQDTLEDIPGVSKVEPEGDVPREIWVEVDTARLRELRLSIAQVAEAIRANNMNLPGGPIEVGEREIFVRTDGMLDTPDQVGELIVRGNDDRTFVRVRDVARVRETFAKRRVIFKSDGRPAINLLVRKQRKGDTIHLAEQVKQVREAHLAAAQAQGMTLTLSNDISYFVKRRLGVMRSNFFQGGVLIMLALFIFLDWRLAVVAAWGVPISFATALAFGIPFMGVTINLLSLMAFIIVLGMLDDDSVVVAENIYRHMEMGKPAEQAAVDGAREVLLPVLGSVAAACAAFLPFAMVSGITGKFMIIIPVVIILCFIASLLEAFFILPAHVVEMSHFGKPINRESSSGRWYTAVVATYRKTLDWLLHHRWKTALILAGFGLITIGVAALRLKIIMFPAGLIDQFFIKVEFTPGTSLSESEKRFAPVEQAVLALPPQELETVSTAIGLMGFDDDIRRGTHYAQARVFLTPEEKRPRSTDAIIAELRQRIGSVPGMKTLEIEKLRAGPPVGRAIYLRVRGRDMEKIHGIVERVKREVSALSGVSDVRSTWEGGKGELQVRVLPEAASFAGLNVETVARHLLFAYEGGEITKIRRPTEEVEIKIRLPENQANRIETFGELEVANSRGYTVPIRRVVQAKEVQAPPFIERYNYRRTVTVSANVDDQTITSRQANKVLKERLASVPRENPGYEIIFGGEEEDTQKSLDSLFRAFGVCILLIFVIVAALFGSYLQPFLILLTVPIGLTGVVYALVLHNKPLSFMALLGVVAMTGVVVNNAIVLVNFINQARGEGLDARQACVQAGATRLRPIWASSVTTLLGLFPTAYGFGGLEPFVQPMALSLAWGLTFAMPLTLFVIPIAYVILDDIKERWRSLRRKTQPPGRSG